jgi:hypothetical protein
MARRSTRVVPMVAFWYECVPLPIYALAWRSWVDQLGATKTPQQNATQAQPEPERSEEEGLEVAERIWLPPRDSNPDMLIQSQLSYH